MAKLHLIKIIAREKKVSIRDLASRVGITEQGLQRIIRENTSKVETLELIANALGVPASIFLDEVNPNNTASGTQSIAGHGNTISGNVNITLPEKGFQKIIRSDGTQTTVELANPNGDSDLPRDLAAENIALQKEISELKSTIIELQSRLLESK